MKDLFRLFVDDAGRRLRALTTPSPAFERTAVAKEAHKIRGAAASFGFDHVASILRIVETQIADLKQARIEEMLRVALQTFDLSVNEVHERYPALAA
jgi:HPt (histidine-containing phosphotransfer) domain-containing protein